MPNSLTMTPNSFDIASFQIGLFNNNESGFGKGISDVSVNNTQAIDFANAGLAEAEHC